jgi:glycosyltransferase involved in cell wall biosynthesis
MITTCKETSSSLAIVGDGPEIEKLKALAKSVGARVTFFGNLEPPEVLKILLQSRIYLNFSDHEGLSFALLEAMACGLPSIVSKVPGNIAVIGDGIDGYTVDIKDTLRLNQIISKLLTSVNLQSKLGQAAIKKVKENYSQDRQLSQVVQLLEQVIIK